MDSALDGSGIVCGVVDDVTCHDFVQYCFVSGGFTKTCTTK